MFLHLDTDTLAQVITRELERQQEAQNLFENEASTGEFEEITFLQNIHQEPTENIQPFNSATERVQQNEEVDQSDNFQTAFQQSNQTDSEDLTQKFQISEQQLEQLQQQLGDIDETEVHKSQETQRFQQSEISTKTLQLSPQHIQQIQHEIQLLDEPVNSKQDIEEAEEYEGIVNLTNNKTAAINISDSHIANQNSTQEQSDYSELEDTEFMSTKQLNASKDTQQNQMTFEQASLTSDQQLTEQSVNQLPANEKKQELLNQKPKQQTLEINTQEPDVKHEDKLPSTNQPPTKEPGTIFEDKSEISNKQDIINESNVSNTDDELNKQHNGDDSFPTFELTTEVIDEVLEVKGQQQENNFHDVEHEQKLEPEDISRFEENTTEIFLSPTPLFQFSTNMDEKRIKSPESIFFGQNKQIEELRKEFKLTAKHFSKKLKSKKEEFTAPKNPVVEQAETTALKWPIFPEVVPLKPQFLQPVVQAKHNLPMKQRFEDESKRPDVSSSKPTKNPTQVFHKQPVPDPIRQVQKISEDLKLRVSQPNPRARSRPIFDPRIRQQQESRKQLQLKARPIRPTPAELKHFQQAEAQIAKAIRLQECINNPTSCQV